MPVQTGKVPPTTDAISWYLQWQVLASLLSLTWWRRAITITWAFSPACIAPAIGFTVASLVFGVGFTVCMQFVSPGAKQPPDLIMYLVTAMIISGIGGGLFVWSLMVWLLRLTAFCEFFNDVSTMPEVSINTTQSNRNKAIVSTQTRKKHLAKFWLVTSLWMLLPLIGIMFLTIALVLTSPLLSGGMVLPAPANFTTMAIVILAGLIWFVLTYSSVAIVASALCLMGPTQSATKALVWTCTYFPATFLIALVLFIATFAISSPQELVMHHHISDIFTAKQNITVVVIANIWSGLTSVILWPLSLAPFCELFKTSNGET